MSIDFAECFTVSARQIAPIIVQRRLGLSFDAEEQLMGVECEPDIASRTLHRLLAAALSVLDGGLLACTASVADDGHAHVRLTGAGHLGDPGRLSQLFAHLALAEGPAGTGMTRQAAGICPVSGASVSLTLEPTEGLVLDAQLPWRRAGEDLPALPSAHGAVAWVLLPRPPGAATLKRRLGRYGWRVRSFGTGDFVDEARGRLQKERPSLVIAVEPERHLTSAVKDWLNLPYDHDAHLVLGALLGSRCMVQKIPARWTRVAMPLSPRDLAMLTAIQEPGFDTRTVAGALPDVAAPPRLLIVDDNTTNCVVASAMADALGYEPMVVNNGLEALRACLHTPPAAVLMDINMPVMDGIAATARLRAEQKAGRIAPFPILGATADAAPETAQAALQAGMDLVMTKPLLFAHVDTELKRLCLRAPR
jgi:CheY-like chemotaxis protein